MITQENIITLPVSDLIRQKAYEFANPLGENYNQKTIRKDNIGRHVGFIGELMTLKYLHNNGIIYDWQNFDPKKPNYNFDININGIKVDIKTKDRTVDPKLNYDCSIAGYSKQHCDYYVFISLTRADTSYHTAHILGYMPHDEYYEKSKAWKKGDIDPSNGWKVSIDCFNLPIQNLYPISDLCKIIT